MFDIEPLRQLSEEDFYESLLLFAQGLTTEETDCIANLSNIASLLYHTMEDINWAGFYLLKGEELVLGPFHGKPACIRIKLESGVCGKAARTGKTVCVEDVHAFEGHIACDATTQSEIVIPICYEGKIMGVLDIDSPKLKRFSETDQVALEALVKHIEKSCQWEV